eukprot:SAG31_NODE_291_length_18308_cov_6.463013_1_plen_144_part_00
MQPHAAAEMLVAFVLVMLAVLADGAGLAGIPPDLLSQYSRMDHGYFTCLDGNGTVPLDYVNDEYCDCPTDGSDEPGTSACAGVSNSTFWCPNVGYVAAAIPTSRVGGAYKLQHKHVPKMHLKTAADVPLYQRRRDLRLLRRFG